MRKWRWIAESENGQSVVDFTSFNKAFEYCRKWPKVHWHIHRENLLTKEIQFDVMQNVNKEIERLHHFYDDKT